MSEARPPEKTFSWGGMLGAGAGTAFRLIRNRLVGPPGRNARVFRGVRSGVDGFMKPVMHALRVLFLEVSGFVFLCISVTVVSTFVHEYRKYAMHQAGVERVILSGTIGAMFLYFGVSSFWRAYQKRSRI